MKILLTEHAEREFKKLERQHQKRIVDVLRELSAGKKNPEPLAGKFKGLFKLRVGDFRIILEKTQPQILIVHHVAHRKEIYHSEI